MIVLLLLRSLVATWLLFPLVTVLGSFLVLVCVLLRIPFENHVIKYWAKSVCWLYGVTVNMHFAERLAPGGFLILFNHSSFFDIFALSSVLPEIRFGAKVELFKIPIFGAAMRSVGVIPITRDQREKSVSALRANETRVTQDGVRVGLSPEGGRLGGEDFLAPFKSGPFYFALGAKAPIQPCIIQGASLVWPKGSLLPGCRQWASQIDLIFLDTIDTEKYAAGDRHQLKDFTYQVMEQALISWRQGHLKASD